MIGKRPRSNSTEQSQKQRSPSRLAASPSVAETALSRQEIFLRVLAFLKPNELARVQGVNRYWQRMSLDPQLWKRLYLSRYPHPHQSRLIYTHNYSNSSPIFTPSRRTLRPIARLPSRSFPPPSPSPTPTPSQTPRRGPGTSSPSPSLTPRIGAENDNAAGLLNSVEAAMVAEGQSVGGVETDVENGQEQEIGWGTRNDGVDWKMMFRLGTNWSNGNASSQQTIHLPPSPRSILSSSTSSSAKPTTSNANTSASPPPYTEQHIALFPSFIVTSTPGSPLVYVYPSIPQPTRPNSSSSASSQNAISSSGLTSALGIIPPPPGWSSPSRPDNVTSICADQAVSLPSPPQPNPSYSPHSTPTSNSRPILPARLAIFYKSGGFVIARITLVDGQFNWVREVIQPQSTIPRRHPRRTISLDTNTDTQMYRYGDSNSGEDPVVLATLYSPILVTCTVKFKLTVYSLPEISLVQNPPSGSATLPRQLKTLYSDVSFHPAALSLFPDSSVSFDIDNDNDHHHKFHSIETSSSSMVFRAALTYCTPMYPSSWTVAVQELGIGVTSEPSHEGTVSRGECYHIGRGDEDDLSTQSPTFGERGKHQNDSAHEGGRFGRDVKSKKTLPAWPKRVRPLVGVHGKAVGVASDGRWCVLAGSDNQIHVYSLPTPSPTPSPPPSLLQEPQDPMALESFKRCRPPYSSHSMNANTSVPPNTNIKPKPIVYAQTLLAHSAAVTSISLSAGRCVSAGRDGRVLVWELDEGHDEEVDKYYGDQESEDEDGCPSDGDFDGVRDSKGSSQSPQSPPSESLRTIKRESKEKKRKRWSSGLEEARLGKSITFVEVKQGGRRERPWRNWADRSQSYSEDDDDHDNDEDNGENDEDDEDDDEDHHHGSKKAKDYYLPHPKSIASAARTMFLPRPPENLRPASTTLGTESPFMSHNISSHRGDVIAPSSLPPPPIKQLAFDEEKIVGLVDEGYGEVMKVWNFTG